MTVANKYRCDGCGKPMHAWTYMRWGVCLDCTKARAMSVGKHGRCVCGSKRVRGDTLRTGSRQWVPCVRCLGVIEQLSYRIPKPTVA